MTTHTTTRTTTRFGRARHRFGRALVNFWIFMGFALLVSSAAAQQAADRFEARLGDANAAHTLYEYSSLTCPHCRDFHRDQLPEIKARFVDAGKLQIVFRHFPLDGVALRAAALSTCVDESLRARFLDALYTRQTEWATTQNEAIDNLARMAQLAGLSDERARQCMNDRQILQRLIDAREQAANEYGVNSTPTLVLDGKKLRPDRRGNYLDVLAESIN